MDSESKVVEGSRPVSPTSCDPARAFEKMNECKQKVPTDHIKERRTPIRRSSWQAHEECFGVYPWSPHEHGDSGDRRSLSSFAAQKPRQAKSRFMTRRRIVFASRDSSDLPPRICLRPPRLRVSFNFSTHGRAVSSRPSHPNSLANRPNAASSSTGTAVSRQPTGASGRFTQLRQPPYFGS